MNFILSDPGSADSAQHLTAREGTRCCAWVGTVFSGGSSSMETPFCENVNINTYFSANYRTRATYVLMTGQ